MIRRLLFRSLAVSVAVITLAWAGVVEDIRSDLDQNNFAAANAELQSYRGQRGVTPEYVEAYSWLARAALTTRQYDQATTYAEHTKTLALGISRGLVVLD